MGVPRAVTFLADSREGGRPSMLRESEASAAFLGHMLQEGYNHGLESA